MSARTGRDLKPMGFGLLISVLVTSCGIIGPGDCTTEARPAIRLRIVDAQTHTKPSVGSSILVTDAGFAESFPPPGVATVSLDQYNFASERPGRYAITVETPGYQDWSKTNINVDRGQCGHVDTETVTATLSAAAP